ncbi:MAG: hypothetical protein PVSMB7_07530 [Chloroflexota bacterium]
MPVRQLMYSPLPMGEARVPMYRVCHYATTPVKIVTSTINPVLPVIPFQIVACLSLLMNDVGWRMMYMAIVCAGGHHARCEGRQYRSDVSGHAWRRITAAANT